MPSSPDKSYSRTAEGDALSVWLVTDVFPPGSGGSGWSTYYLGKALQERGHRVTVLRPRYGGGVSRPGKRAVEYRGLQVEEILVPVAPRWARRLGLSRAWEERSAGDLMARRLAQVARNDYIDIMHGQHMVSTLAVSKAARVVRRSGVRCASVATVRDYWPLCPVSTRLFNGLNGETFECQDCHRLRAYLDCVGATQGKGLRRTAFAALRWLRTYQVGRALGRCDAVVTVSDYVRGEIERSGRVHGGKLVTMPNMLDLQSVDAALSGEWPLREIAQDEPFLLFIGKWDVNKGAQMLPSIVAQSGIRLPVVLAGEGPMRDSIAQEASGLGLDFRFYSWLKNEEAILLMRHASALLFPSAWQEPLSRVLLEGCAAGAAIVALDTGGTGDVIIHGESGWLAKDAESMADGLKAVISDERLREVLRRGARKKAEDTFASENVITRVETLYRRLLA